MRRLIDRIGEVALLALATPFMVHAEVDRLARRGEDVDAARRERDRAIGERDEARRVAKRAAEVTAANYESLRLLRHDGDAERARLRGTIEALEISRLAATDRATSAEYAREKAEAATADALQALSTEMGIRRGAESEANHLRAALADENRFRLAAETEAKRARVAEGEAYKREKIQADAAKSLRAEFDAMRKDGDGSCAARQIADPLAIDCPTCTMLAGIPCAEPRKWCHDEHPAGHKCNSHAGHAGPHRDVMRSGAVEWPRGTKSDEPAPVSSTRPTPRGGCPVRDK
jgi:hypothetical protein